MLAAVQKNYLPPSIVCADDASQTSGLRLELDVSSKALDVKSGDPSHAMVSFFPCLVALNPPRVPLQLTIIFPSSAAVS